MFPSLSRFPVAVLALLNACGTIAATYPFTVYRGTFIHLPRLNSASDKPELNRNQGVLWVSSADGRIKGYDWTVKDDASFQSFLSSHGWADANSTTRDRGTKVQVVKSNDARNEFFFPGFIGGLHLPCSIPSQY
jgi:guanine deaminase